jgi:hypothetical protein
MYIVRSKANQHTRNMLADVGYDSNDDPARRIELSTAARDKFVKETPEGTEIWVAAENAYNERVTRVENQIIAQPRLGTARNANEMCSRNSMFCSCSQRWDISLRFMMRQIRR